MATLGKQWSNCVFVPIGGPLKEELQMQMDASVFMTNTLVFLKW